MWVGGKGRTKDVHDLVLTAFVGPRPAGSLGLHWNDIPTDNRLENLRWGTKRDNSLDALRNGKNRPPISRRGIEHYEARLSFEQVTLISELVAAGKAKKALARQFGVTDKTIANYARGKVRVAA